MRQVVIDCVLGEEGEGGLPREKDLRIYSFKAAGGGVARHSFKFSLELSPNYCESVYPKR